MWVNDYCLPQKINRNVFLYTLRILLNNFILGTAVYFYRCWTCITCLKPPLRYWLRVGQWLPDRFHGQRWPCIHWGLTSCCVLSPAISMALLTNSILLQTLALCRIGYFKQWGTSYMMGRFYLLLDRYSYASILLQKGWKISDYFLWHKAALHEAVDSFWLNF